MLNDKKYTKGHFMGIGLAIGIPISIPVGLIFGNIGYGPLIGLAIGLTIGYLMEKSNNKNPILQSEQELKNQIKWAKISVVVGLMLFVILAATYFVMM